MQQAYIRSGVVLDRPPDQNLGLETPLEQKKNNISVLAHLDKRSRDFQDILLALLGPTTKYFDSSWRVPTRNSCMTVAQTAGTV